MKYIFATAFLAECLLYKLFFDISLYQELYNYFVVEDLILQMNNLLTEIEQRQKDLEKCLIS